MPDSFEDPAVTSGLVQSVPGRFVLVTGSGRSGTSSVAGALNYLGLHVPRPVLGANPSNPLGFFESTWPIDFHKRLLHRAGVDMWDGRPDALAKVQEVVLSEHGAEIEEWLAKAFIRAPQVVVKDPRSCWVPSLWSDAAARVGMSPGYITMLRHPAEVVGSRSTYYAKGDAQAVRSYQITSVARWINAILITERQTRSGPRVLLRYTDLISDWRSAMDVVRRDLGLAFNANVESDEPHAVDQFIDPGLRRHESTWDELDIPSEVRSIAEEIWLMSGVLADSHGRDDKAEAALDLLGERYAELFRDAGAIAHDLAAARARRAGRKAVRQGHGQIAQSDETASLTGPRTEVAPPLRRLVARARSVVRRWTGV